MSHTYVSHDRTGLEQYQHVTPLRVATGAWGELPCNSMALCSAWLSGRGGNGGTGRPCGDGQLSGSCGSGSNGRWSGSSGGSGSVGDGVGVGVGVGVVVKPCVDLSIDCRFWLKLSEPSRNLTEQNPTLSVSMEFTA